MSQAAAMLAEQLERVPLFAALTQAERLELARSCSLRALSPGEVLCREGDPGDGLFLLVTGRARVTKRSAAGGDEVLGELGELSVVGEMSLLDGLPRSATVSAVEGSTCWRLARSEFDRRRAAMAPAAFKVVRFLAGVLCGRLRELNAKMEDFWADPARALRDLQARGPREPARPPVPAPPAPPAARLAVPPLDEDGAPAALVRFLSRVPLLEGMPQAELEELSAIFTPLPMAPGDAVGREGGPADAFYVVARGRLLVQKRVPNAAPVTLARAGPGVLLGEVSLIDRGPRSATVVAPAPALVLRCEREDFERLFRGGSGPALRFVDRLAADLSRRVREADARFADLFADPTRTAQELSHRLSQVGASLEGGDALGEGEPLLVFRS